MLKALIKCAFYSIQYFNASVTCFNFNTLIKNNKVSS